MAPLPVIDGVFRVAFNWAETGGQLACNVMHFRKVSGSATALQTALEANVAANMWAYTRNSASIRNTTITPLDGTSATIVTTTSGSKWTGVSPTGDFMPAAAQVVSFKSPVRGRRARGRVYLPFIAEAVSQNGSITGSVAAQQAAWDAFVAAMLTATYPLVIASYVASEYHLVSSVNVQAVLGTQRNRQSRLR